MKYSAKIEKLFKEVLNTYKRAPDEFTQVDYVITISGTSGSGKSSHARRLKEYLEGLGYNVVLLEAGEIYRQIAKEYGYDGTKLDEFSEAIRKGKIKLNVDYEIDKRTLLAALGYQEYVPRYDNNKKTVLIVVSRLGSLLLVRFKEYLRNHNLTLNLMPIYLTCNYEIVAKRIKSDPNRPESKLSEKEIIENLKKRDEEDKKRYKILYGIRDFIKSSKKCSTVISNEKDFDSVQRAIRKNIIKHLIDTII